MTRTAFPFFSSKFLVFELSVLFFACFLVAQAEEQSLEIPPQTLSTEAAVIPQITETITPSEGAIEPLLVEPVTPVADNSESIPPTETLFTEPIPSVEEPTIELSPTTIPEGTQPPETTETPEVVDPPIEPTEEIIPPVEDYSSDYTLYKQYLLFQKYEQYQLYKKYERYAGVAWRAKYFESKKAEKKYLKSLKKKYDKYRKKPSRYPQYLPLVREYTGYKDEKNIYFATKSYAGYGHLLRFNRPEYETYKDYGSELHKVGYERYKKALEEGKVTDTGDADLDASELGPYIPVGIFNFVPNDLRESAFKIKATGNWKVLHRNGETLAAVAADKSIRVKYTGDKRFRVYDPDTDVTLADTSKEVRFEADSVNTIFDVNRPNSSFDRYRGNIKLRYYDSPESDGDRIWVINTLPLEHYVWGMGEITGAGPDEYDKLMTTIFRTYGYWKLKWSTKYADQGFKVDATAGNQVYLGYDWEVTHPDIRKGAETTQGTLVMYQREVALTPYSSWTDGNTRRFEDGHWGRSCKTETGKNSTLYPWLSSTSDTRGKHETESTCSLATRGNHMVGLSANGAVRMAKYDNATWDTMLEHYYPGVDLIRAY